MSRKNATKPATNGSDEKMTLIISLNWKEKDKTLSLAVITEYNKVRMSLKISL